MFSDFSLAPKPFTNALWPSITLISWNLRFLSLYNPDQTHSPPTQQSSPHAFNTITVAASAKDKGESKGDQFRNSEFYVEAQARKREAEKNKNK